MRRIRPVLLAILLVAAVSALYYHFENPVHTETHYLNSTLLGKTLEYGVVLPKGYRLFSSRRTRYSTIYLLHGWSAHYDSWLTRTNLVQYAAEHQLIVVLVEGDDGWYTDSTASSTAMYESYIVQELIPEVDERLRTVADKRGRAIAGFSMGGYGAVKFGLKHPELFSFVGSMSGAFDAPTRIDDESIMHIFGGIDSTERKANDVFRLASEIPAGRIPQLPFFYVDCGWNDPWLPVNQRFVSILSERKIPVEFYQTPGNHNWPYWDKQLGDVLRIAEDRLNAAGR